MIPKDIRLSDLQILLDKKYGAKQWVSWEMETIMHDMPDSDYLVAEKVFVLQALNSDVNASLALPEFLIWASQVANNQYAEFEIIMLPTSLEVAWAIDEARLIAAMTGQLFIATEELTDTVAYLLKEDGYSVAPSQLGFVPSSKLSPGQTKEDIEAKNSAVTAYIKHMREYVYDRTNS
jgi:hypothetical protein